MTSEAKAGKSPIPYTTAKHNILRLSNIQNHKARARPLFMEM
jgi:hypothetical protein